MALALAAERGRASLPSELDLRPIAEKRIVLLDARDMEPGEEQVLSGSRVHRVSLGALDAASMPQGPLDVHLDADVCDAGEPPGLPYPVSGGPTIPEVLETVAALLSTGRVWP